MSSQPKTKEQIRAEAEALFIQLDEEFGKKKVVKAAPVKKEIIPSEGREANKLAALLSENSVFRQVAHVTHVIKQICSCCQGETELIGNVLIRFEHKVKRFTWDTMVPPDASHSRLPRVIESHDSYVQACAACTRFDMHVAPIDTTDFQLKLFQ